VQVFRALCVVPVQYSTQIMAINPKRVFQWKVNKTCINSVANHMVKLSKDWAEFTCSQLKIDCAPPCLSNVPVKRLQRSGGYLAITSPHPGKLIKNANAWRCAHMRWLWVGFPSCIWNELKQRKLAAPHTYRPGNSIHILFNADQPLSKQRAVNHEFMEWLVGWLKRSGTPDKELPKSHSDPRFQSEYLSQKLMLQIEGAA